MEQMLEQARNTLQMEADAILELVPRVDEHFSAAVAMILDCPGRVVITGMGKSGIIGRKNGGYVCQYRYTIVLSPSCRRYSR